MPTLSILIPVYNEQAYLERLVERVESAWLPEDIAKEIVIVNDASTDNTSQVIERLCKRFSNIKAFDQPVNAGKGAAIRRAIDEMCGDYAIIQDADLEYDPDEYHIVLKPLLAGYADVVYGSRFATREMRKVLFYHHKLGNYFLTFLSNLTTGLDLTDMETCYKAFRGQVLKSIPLRSNRFGIEPEITAKIAKRGLSVYEVPISYHGRKYSEGKKIGWKDGFSAMWTILKFWFLDDYAKESDELQVQNSPDNMRQFNREIVRRCLPWLGDRTLELQSHVGLISRFLPQREKLVVSDSREACVDFLKNLYDGNAVVDVLKIALDGGDDKDDETRASHDSPGDVANELPIAQFDSVLFVHGLEKTDKERQVLARIREMLRPGGRLILIVPQHPFLSCALDRTLDYRRRYDKPSIKVLLAQSGFETIRCQAVHPTSFFAWFLNGKLIGRKTIGKLQLKFLNALVPLCSLLPLPGGNLFIVAEKRDSSASTVR